MKHEDNRRMLIEWIKDAPIRSCKVVITKKDGGTIGSHYHKNKDEYFFLLSGSGTYKFDNGEWKEFTSETLFVPRGVRHEFNLSEGSILLGAATGSFDENDEIKS